MNFIVKVKSCMVLTLQGRLLIKTMNACWWKVTLTWFLYSSLELKM